jgi:hypothetical protein
MQTERVEINPASFIFEAHRGIKWVPMTADGAYAIVFERQITYFRVNVLVNGAISQ